MSTKVTRSTAKQIGAASKQVGIHYGVFSSQRSDFVYLECLTATVTTLCFQPQGLEQGDVNDKRYRADLKALGKQQCTDGAHALIAGWMFWIDMVRPGPHVQCLLRSTTEYGS